MKITGNLAECGFQIVAKGKLNFSDQQELFPVQLLLSAILDSMVFRTSKAIAFHFLHSATSEFGGGLGNSLIFKFLLDGVPQGSKV